MLISINNRLAAFYKIGGRDLSKEISEQKPIIGDATGIGPEIVAKVAAKRFYQKYCLPIIIGDQRVLRLGMKNAKVDFPYTVYEDIEEVELNRELPVLDQKNLDPSKIKQGVLSAYSGKAAGDLLITAINLFKKGKIDGFTFAPLNKAALRTGGHDFESEHMLFAHYFNWTEPYGEMNVLGDVWTSRVTSHIPIKEVSSKLSKESILKAIVLADKTLKRVGIRNSKVAVAALNPHSGENGLCGREEIDVIIPAIEEASKMGINIAGPYSPDILFYKAFNGEFDVAVTMYHDQGQIAMKLKGFEQGITVAAGFPAPIVTSAHGTAYDIVGKGIAKTTAFENAVKMTAKMALFDKKAFK